MTPGFKTQVEARSSAIRDRWTTLLHLEPVSGPLANPDALEYLIPQMCAEILAACGGATHPAMTLERARAESPTCTCNQNPYRAFFAAAEQALTEIEYWCNPSSPPLRAVPLILRS